MLIAHGIVYCAEDEMEDRELDALVVEKIFGADKTSYHLGDWHYHHHAWNARLESHWRVVPHYSTDIAAAWSVVEKMGDCAIDKRVSAKSLYRASFSGGVACSDSLPRAICIAALKAVGVDVQSKSGGHDGR